MSRFIYLCKKMIQGQYISKKIKFAEKVIRKHKLKEAEVSKLLDYVFYDDIQSKDRFLTNEEIEKNTLGYTIKQLKKKQIDMYVF